MEKSAALSFFIFEGRTPMAEIKLPSNSITTGNAEKHEKKVREGDHWQSCDQGEK